MTREPRTQESPCPRCSHSCQCFRLARSVHEPARSLRVTPSTLTINQHVVVVVSVGYTLPRHQTHSPASSSKYHNSIHNHRISALALLKAGSPLSQMSRFIVAAVDLPRRRCQRQTLSLSIHHRRCRQPSSPLSTSIIAAVDIPRRPCRHPAWPLSTSFVAAVDIHRRRCRHPSSPLSMTDAIAVVPSSPMSTAIITTVDINRCHCRHHHRRCGHPSSPLLTSIVASVDTPRRRCRHHSSLLSTSIVAAVDSHRRRCRHLSSPLSMANAIASHHIKSAPCLVQSKSVELEMSQLLPSSITRLDNRHL